MADPTAMHFDSIDDWIRLTNNGNTVYGRLNREISLMPSLIHDLPIAVSSQERWDEGYFKDEWEYNKYSRTNPIDEYYLTSQHDIYGRYDVLGLRTGAAAVYKYVEDTIGDSFEALRAQQVKEKFRGTMMDIEKDLVYGDPYTDSDNCLGMMARCNVITDRNGIIQDGTYDTINPYVTISAGGEEVVNSDGVQTRNGYLTSAYIVVPGAEDACCRLIPGGTRYTGGIRYTRGNKWEIEKGTNKKYNETGIRWWTADTYDVAYGLAVKNRRALVRIANIDWNNPDDKDTGIANFLDAFAQARAAIDDAFEGRPHYLYMSQDLMLALRAYFRRNTSPTTVGDAIDAGFSFGNSFGDITPKKLIHLMGDESIVPSKLTA